MHDDCKPGSATLSRMALLLFWIGALFLYSGSLVEREMILWAKLERMNALSDVPLPDHREAGQWIRLAVYAVYALGSVLVATGLVGWCAPGRLRGLLPLNRQPQPAVDDDSQSRTPERTNDVH